MRAWPWLILVCCALGCERECQDCTPPPPAPPPPPVESCRPRSAPTGDGCAPVGDPSCTDPEGCQGLAARGCPLGSRARIGQAECVPAGINTCPAGFVHEGYGCRAIWAEGCVGATYPRLGEVECRPVGDCDAPFPPADATHFVDPAGPVDSTHYTTISGALAAAPAGAVVAVAAGTYAEDLLIRRTVRVVGRCADQVRVVGTGQALPGLWVRVAQGVEVQGLSLIGHDGGIELDGGAGLRAQDLVLEANAGTSLLLLQGSRLELQGSVARDTRPRNGDGGRGASVQAGSQLVLRDVAFTEHREFGIYVSGIGSELESDGLLVQGTLKNGLEEGGDHLHLRGGAQGVLRRTALIEGQTRGLVLTGEGSRAELEGVGIESITLGIGLEVADGAVLQGRALDLGFSVGAGLVVRSASVSLSEASIHDVRIPGGAEDAFAVAVYQGGQLTLREAALSFNEVFALAVEDPESRLQVFETLVHATRGDLAPGVAILGGATLVAQGLSVSDSGAAGVLVNSSGGQVELTETLIEDTRPHVGPVSGGGLVASAGTVKVERSTIRGNSSTGVVIGRSVPPLSEARVELSNSTVEDTRRREDLADVRLEGYGVWVSTGSTLSASRSNFLDNQLAGVGVMVGAVAELYDCEIRRTLPNRDGYYGQGLYTNGRVKVRRCWFSQNTTMGIQVHGPDAWAEIEDSVIGETKAQGDGILGHGVVTSFSGQVRIDRSLIFGSAGAALGVESGGARVSASELSANTVGVLAAEAITLEEVAPGPGDPAAGRAQIANDTIFLENGSRTSLGVILIPAPLSAPE